MKCSQVREKIYEFIEGTLQGTDLSKFEEHLRGCQDCQREFKSVKKLDARLRQEIPIYWESVEPSPSFLNRLKRLELEPEKIEKVGILDSILALFQQHRVAFATGLSVCLVVAVAIGITSISLQDDDEDVSQIAKYTPTETGPAELEMMPSESLNIDDEAARSPNLLGGTSEHETQKAGGITALPGTTGPESVPAPEPAVPNEDYLGDTALTEDVYEWDTEEFPEEGLSSVVIETSEPSIPMPDITSPSAIEPAEETGGGSGGINVSAIENISQAREKQMAVWIALGDSDVQKELEGETLQSVEIHHEAPSDDPVCSGPTVELELKSENAEENVLVICVDLNLHEVVDVARSPA